MYRFEELNTDYYMKKNDEKGTVDSSSRRSLNMVYFFMTEMCSQIDDMYTYKHSFNADFEKHPLYRLAENMDFDLIKTNSNKYSEIMELYICLIKLTINNRDEESFQKARAIFKNIYSSFSSWGKLDIYASLISACIKLEILDKRKYTKESFQIQREMVENNIYSDPVKSPMNMHMYRRCILLAEIHKDFEWMERFIRENTHKLPPEFRENMENFSNAIYSFGKGKYSDSLKYAGRISFEMFAFKYDLKMLLLKIYYELNHTEQTLSMIESYRHFLSDNRSLSEIKKETQRNFIQFTADLLRMKTDREYSGINIIRRRLEQTNTVSEKEWLLEKINEIEASN
jgi:hypothetical protein